MSKRYINIEFSYNGDLGKLQHTTVANIQFADELYYNGVITKEEYIKLIESIKEYFKKQIESVNNNINFYINN